MKENELRIGNYVKINNPKHRAFENGMTAYVCMISSLGKKPCIGCYLKDGDYDFGQFIEFVEPIPLTEEWIIKMGFKKLNNSMFRRGALTIQWTTVTTGETLNEKILSSQKAIRICLAGSFVCNVSYVHKLQNFFYAISGNEILD